MRSFIKDYFSHVWGTDIAVTKTLYDAGDLITTDPLLAVKSVYEVTLLKRILGPSYSGAAILQDTIGATITLGMPKQDSTAPIQGNFIITCADDFGTSYSTQELSYDYWTQGIDFHMQLEIPHLQSKIFVRNLFDYQYRENGVAFAVVFSGYEGNVPECAISSGVTTPITGNNVVFATNVVREYGTNLMFEPVPLEMLYTDAQAPQVTVSVNGIDGVCPQFNCDYTYVSTTAMITGQSISGNTLTITGTNLPTTDIRVRLANSECGTITSSSTTSITCTLSHGAAAGSWYVQLTDASGLAPISTAVSAINIALSISSVSPSTGLNQLGGDLITFTGTGFDTTLDSTSIAFSDGTTCTATATSDTSLTCEVDGFNASTLDTVNPYTSTVTVNGVANSSQSVTLLSTKQSGVSVAPSSVSPVLATQLVISLESTYPYALAASDFQAKLVLASDPTVSRPLYVMSVDDTAKTVTVKFNGAESGDY